MGENKPLHATPKSLQTKGHKIMTYQELKTQLRLLKKLGYATVIPALNSKKKVLEKALKLILATLTKKQTKAFNKSREGVCEAGAWILL